ncbi:conserved hypothetical protein [delta proteobacterium NaphS2]|nr:conserved hypothetical protein [delta proteobacterium NaphS2]
MIQHSFQVIFCFIEIDDAYLRSPYLFRCIVISIENAEMNCPGFLRIELKC